MPVKSQLDCFKEAARELETDDDEALFTEKLRRMVKPKSDAKKCDHQREGGGSRTHDLSLTRQAL